MEILVSWSNLDTLDGTPVPGTVLLACIVHPRHNPDMPAGMGLDCQLCTGTALPTAV